MKNNKSAILIVGVWLVIIMAMLISCGKEPMTSQPVVPKDNPLAKALKSGMPVVADFGRGTCIPCKAMKPILEELMQTYKGKAEIFIFNIDEYKDLTKQYGINLIPTQIIFDKSGKEIMRHEGFLEKDKIIEQLNELGVQ